MSVKGLLLLSCIMYLSTVSAATNDTNATNETAAVNETIVVDNKTYTPIVFFHGITSNCIELQDYVNLVKDQMPNNNTYIKCIEIGSGKMSTWFMNMNDQVRLGCQGIKNDPVFNSTPVNIIGFSQGGLISRSIVETCTGIQFRKLITFGAPHGGVSSIKDCDGNYFCYFLDFLVKFVVYIDFIQYFIAPADYYRVFDDVLDYLKFSSFLPFVNNEENTKDHVYRDRILSLEHFRMFMWESDEVVFPKQSAWFSQFDNKGNLVNLTSSEQYQSDWLGLKTMDEAKKLSFLSLPGLHMELNATQVKQDVIPMLLD